VTPEDLVEIEQIKRLKHRYARLLDQKQFDELERTVFAEDATASYGGGTHELDGRTAIVDWLRNAMGSTSMLTSHMMGQPEIDLVGDGEATGSWSLQDVVVLVDLGVTVRGASYYSDRYVKVDGDWRIAHTGYRRVYEELEPRREEIKLTASWWGTDGRSSLG
jgi:hypothetical protein